MRTRSQCTPSVPAAHHPVIICFQDTRHGLPQRVGRALKGPPCFSVSKLLLTFAERLLCGRYCFQCFVCIISVNPQHSPPPQETGIVTRVGLWVTCSTSIPPSGAAVRTSQEASCHRQCHRPRAPSASPSAAWMSPSVTDCDGDAHARSFLKDKDPFAEQLWSEGSQMALPKLPQMLCPACSPSPLSLQSACCASDGSPSLTQLAARALPSLFNSCLMSASQRSQTISPFSEKGRKLKTTFSDSRAARVLAMN